MGNRRPLRLLLAGAAETFFFVGLLAAVGLVEVGIALLVLSVLAAVVLGSAWLLRRRPQFGWPHFGRVHSGRAHSGRARVERPRLAVPRPQVSMQRPLHVVAVGAAATAGAARGAATRIRPVAAAGVAGTKAGLSHVGPAAERVRIASVAASRRIAERAREVSASPPSAERLLGAMESAKGRALASPDVHVHFQEQEAVRLNALGSRLRRTGDAEGAAEQHRAALHFFRTLGDRRAEALTLNNIGLALASGGADETAVEQFQAAVEILDELDDRQHAGQVLANLGATHLRHGRSDEATEFLHSALAKLEPSSPAARRVEEQLSRAS